MLLHHLDESLDHVVVFEISAGLLQERIALRASQSAEAGSAVRTDDTAQVLEKRILEFERATAALMPFYERRGLLRRIDARMPIGAVTENILRIVKREDV
jgi:adenylate kinase